MKKILYVELSSGFGGSSEVLFSCLKYLNREKFDPVLLVTRQGKNFDLISASLGIKKVSFPLLSLKHEINENFVISYLKAFINLVLDVVPNAWCVWSVIRREKIDLVHINTNIKNNLQAILAAKWAGVPCVCHVRETRVLLRMEKYYKRFLDRIVVLNTQAFDIMKDGFDPRKVVLIPDGHDLCLSVKDADLQKIREQFQLDGKYCVGILGRLVVGKGQDDFIRAASIILKEHENVKFLIVGNDPDLNKSFEEKLLSLVRELHLGGNIIFTGWRTDKNEMISVLDMVVQASSTFPEGFGLTCIEAMAFKKPVVATNIPGPNSIVVNGITGFLVPPADPASLAAAMIKIIKDPLLARSLGEAGKRRVEECFDIKIVVKKIESMYDSIFGKAILV